jgi:hypothetical protein
MKKEAADSEWVRVMEYSAPVTPPIKEEDIDHTWLLAEDEARHGRFGELVELLRHPKGRPLTRGERLVLADILEGKVKRPKKRPPTGYWHSDLADTVGRAVNAHRKAGKAEKDAVYQVAKDMDIPQWKVRKLNKAAVAAYYRLNEQAPRVIAAILKRGYQ